MGGSATACQSGTESTPESSSQGSVGSHEEALRQLAADLEIPDPPDVEVVREISPSESSGVHNACLVEAGWIQNDDGSFSIPDEQMAAHNLSSYKCAAAYPIADHYLQPMQSEQWSLVYNHYVEEFIPCAAEQGFQVSEPPTRERFIAYPESWHR